MTPPGQTIAQDERGEEMKAIDITKFCAPDGKMAITNHPWAFDGRTIATEGHILISVPHREEWKESLPEGKNAEYTRGILADIDAQTFTPMPKIPFPKRVECVECNGLKVVPKAVTCKECEGEGVVEFSNDYNSYHPDCLTCYGEGHVDGSTSIACIDCNGQGKRYPQAAHVSVGAACIDPKYLKLIAGPGVEFATPDWQKLYFRIGDAFGIIMGMRI